MKSFFTTKNFKEKTLRDIVQRIVIDDISKFKKKDVLEIGCGNWSHAKKIFEKNNCIWRGVDPLDFGKENISKIKGSVGKLPFHDNSFDAILSIQSIEHWFEYGVSFKKALNEIHRVLRPGGVAIINGPIHVHGHPYFLRGDLKRIFKQFNKKKKWFVSLFERCIPSTDVKRWKKLGETGWKGKVGYPDFLIPKAKNKYSYIINIHLKKKGKLNYSKKSRSEILRQISVLARFVKEYIFYWF